MMVGIAACDPQGVMGHQGGLPWHEPDDLKHFRNKVRGHSILVGRKTFDSMPVQPDCETIVLSRTWPVGLVQPRVYVTNTIHAACTYAHTRPQSCFVIGGRQIFDLCFGQNLITQMILTRFSQSYSGDVFFPLTALDGWHRIETQPHPRFVIETWQSPFSKKEGD